MNSRPEATSKMEYSRFTFISNPLPMQLLCNHRQLVNFISDLQSPKRYGQLTLIYRVILHFDRSATRTDSWQFIKIQFHCRTRFTLLAVFTLLDSREKKSNWAMTNSNIVHLLDFENPVFASFILWSCILLLKTLLMSVFTTYYRSKNKVNITTYRPARVRKSHTYFEIFICFFLTKPV